MPAGGSDTLMSETHATDVPGHGGSTGIDHHDPSDHGNEHGHDDHAHGAEALGPLDIWAWGAGVLGLGIAVAIAVCFALATSGLA